MPVAEGHTAGLLVMHGEVLVGEGTAGGGQPVVAGDLVVLDREGADLTLRATADATVLVMSGQPIDEPISGYGPFVMNTAEEIRQAIADMRSGRLAS